jgi:hypothetical protein
MTSTLAAIVDKHFGCECVPVTGAAHCGGCRGIYRGAALAVAMAVREEAAKVAKNVGLRALDEVSEELGRAAAWETAVLIQQEIRAIGDDAKGAR